MSVVEQEDGPAEIQECPDPEEDSDLSYRHHHEETGMDCFGEEDYAEEDLALAQETGATVSQNMADGRSESSDLIEGSTDMTDKSEVRNVDIDPKNNIVSSDLSDPEKRSIEKYPGIVADAGENFKEVESMFVGDSEMSVKNEAFFKSDGQLFLSQENISSHHEYKTSFTENGVVLESQISENEPEVQNTCLELENKAISSDTSLQENDEDTCKVTRAVDGTNSLDKNKVEGDILIKDRETCSLDEREKLSMDEISGISAEPENLPFSTTFPLLEELENETVDLCDTGAENDLPDENRDPVNSVSLVHDLSASDCSKEDIHFNEVLNGAGSEAHTIAASDLTNTMPDLHNFSGCPLLIRKQDSSFSDQSPDSYDLSEAIPDFENRNSKENVSVSVSSCTGDNDTKGSCENEYQFRTSVSTYDGQLIICRTPNDSGNVNITSKDDSLTHAPDNISSHQHNTPSIDHSNYIQHTQQTIVSPASEQLRLNTDILNQQNSSAVISDDTIITDNKSDESSKFASPLNLVFFDNSEHMHSDPDNGCSHTQTSQFNSQNYSSVTSHSPPQLVSPTTQGPNNPSKTHNQILEPTSATASLQNASPPCAVLFDVPLQSIPLRKEQTAAPQNGNKDKLLQNHETEVSAASSRIKSPQKSVTDPKSRMPDKKMSPQTLNGLQSVFDFNQVNEYNKQLLEQLRIRDEEIARLTSELNSKQEAKPQVQSVVGQPIISSSQLADDLYLPQIKVMELTIAQQQKEIQALKVSLVSQDNAAKKAIASLQNELKSRVEQMTKMYDESVKEKDMIVVRFAESEAKNMEAKRVLEKNEIKVKEAMRDREMMFNAMQAAKADKQKALSNFETKCIEISNLQKEVEKLKEALSSSEHRIKWFQAKLKEELESHKETKNTLEKANVKLKEAREETEIIRRDCHAIVKKYQESDEIKSNSLDKELKLKETELRTQLQERNDTEEIHQMLKKELDSLKAQHKDTIEEAKTYKDKVQCLEEERKQNHQMIENYQEIMQRQKTSIAELNMKILSLSALEEDYKRSQETIQTLETDITDLKLTNQELQKDMESCSERESRMLALQSELSHANALLRSENTNLHNKISSLTSEVEKLKTGRLELEAAVKTLRDTCEQERAKRKEEGEKMATILADKTRECDDLRQKWEDEIDNSKTLKRRHANNIKDLNRQLHQVHKRLEAQETKGDAGSMGSRTNSNGSVNSLENASRLSFPTNQQAVQEFPVITEQVEVDKSKLIERIVRLQKSLARKNEKLEFLSEHIQQLLEDIRKKNKVIQCYALRDECGTLSSEEMDAHKAKVQKEMQTLLARKGGIMASLYSAHQQDGTMTLDLSLQISRKLQAVLEDTILKNITLKESLDTLGEEIARLSQENRKLQLHLQKVEGNMA